VKKRKKVMNLSLAKRAIDFLSPDLAEPLIEIGELGLFGGEPLLEWNLIKKIIAYAETKPNIKKFGVATNGLLLNKEILEYFIEHNVYPALSIDGIQIAQDRH